MSHRSSLQVKDALLQYISEDIKKLQSLQCDIATVKDSITSNSMEAQKLCEHFDRIFLHGLYNNDNGYWPCVSYFTHKDLIKSIMESSNITTNIGRGRCWLNITLNEQVMESYLRMFIENQLVIKEYYGQEAFLRDIERLSVLLTLVSGLDFVTFELATDKKYLNSGASPNSLIIEESLNFDITPLFRASASRRIKNTSSDQFRYEPGLSPTSSPSLQIKEEQQNDSGVFTSDIESASSHTQPLSSSPIEKSQITEDSTVTDRPSFLDRFVQLNLQEKEQIQEEFEFVVARQKKPKGKRRKKKKESIKTESNDVQATPTPDTEEIINSEPMLPELPDKPVLLDGPDVLSDVLPDEPILAAVEHSIENIPTIETPAEFAVQEVVDQSHDHSHDQSHDIKQSLNDMLDSETSTVPMSHDDHIINEVDAMSHDDHVINEVDAKETDEEGTDFEDTTKPDNTEPLDDDCKLPPTRPKYITDEARRECDLPIDQSTKLILSLEVFGNPDENLIRLIQIKIPVSHGNYQTAYLAITDEAVYLIERDGTEGNYSRMAGVAYDQVEHIIIGLSWQSLSLVYKIENYPTTKQIIITGSEAVSRNIADCIRMTAATTKQFPKSIPLNKDDETRIEAIERELIKLGSETSFELIRYCLVHWEQLSGDMPLFAPPTNTEVPFSGNLYVKEGGLLKALSWKTAYFTLIEGTLFHFNSENDKAPKATYPLRGPKCGCMRAKGEGKDFAFTVWDSNGSTLLLATEDEEQMSKWMQLLCMAAMGVETTSQYRSPIHTKGAYCAVLLTQNKIHVLQEDWSSESVELITSISVQDVNMVGIDMNIPLYCTLSYECEDGSHGVWMLCFTSEYELGQFEKNFIANFNDIFQVDPTFSIITDEAVKRRSVQALELMRASRQRNDSLTRGRTEFTYD